MSKFYCEVCHQNEDSEEVGYVVLPDGREVCARAADDLYDDDRPPVPDHLRHWDKLDLIAKRLRRED